jgi:hypothetical protein
MEPAGLSWQALYARLQSWGSEGSLGPCHAVRTHRQTRQDGTSKTDAKDAYSLFDLLRPGTGFLPGARAPALPAASRLLPRSMAWNKRLSPLRHQRRAARPLALPALTPLLQDLPPPTAWRFLQAQPTPASLLRPGRPHFLEQWPPHPRCGPWRPETCHRRYDVATARLGLHALARLDEVESPMLADALVDALPPQPRWLDQAMARRAQRAASPLLGPLPRIGTPPPRRLS